MTHPTLDELIAARDGEASSETAAHVESCQDCQQTVGELQILRQHLQALPQVKPPADGWTSMRSRLQARRQSDFLARCGWATAAAMVLFTATVAIRGGIEAWEEARLSHQIETLVAESQRLEGQVHSADASGRVMSGRTAYAIADLQGRIEELDARLSTARRERRPTQEVVELWQQRVSLLDDLANVQSARVAYVGI